jgi:WD40 repeat protein
MLTLSNQILIYSLELKTLIFVGEAFQGKTPCFIEKAVYQKGQLFFSATDQFTLFSVRISECIKTGNISHYNKFKMPEVRASALAVGGRKLVALCSDNHLRVWDTETTTALKSIYIERSGEPVCLSFSKECEHLLVGTATGLVLGYDA